MNARLNLAIALLSLLAALPALARDPLPPEVGTITAAPARLPQPTTPMADDLDLVNGCFPLEERFRLQDKVPFVDDDTAHYARGSVAVVLVFVNHAGGTWDAAERAEMAQKAVDAKQYYLDYKPSSVFLTFDHEGESSYFYYTATVPYDIGDYDDFTLPMLEDAAENLGFDDDDGDNSVIDDMTIWLQGQNGGWDNVIAVFVPADYHFAPAQAGWTTSWVKVSPNMSWGTLAHELGHAFGACDEGGGPAGCNNIDCDEVCMSYYLVDQVPNGNCDDCAVGVDCIMRGYVNVGPCPFTVRNWAWVDADANGALDNTVAWNEDDQALYQVWELFHNGWMIHTNTTWGMVANQRWTSWSAIGVRSRGASSYAISVFGENNRRYHLASDYLSPGVRFVVGDFNHNNLGQDHVRLTNLGGAGQYVLSYESGTQVLYPDGVDRAQTWSANNVVRAWDVPLFANETIQVQLDVDTPALNLGMALFKSNGGVYYAPRTSALWQANDWPAGISESHTFTVPEDDVYGLVVWSDTEVDGNFSIQIGPSIQPLTHAVPFASALDLRLYSYQPATNFWAVSAARPGASSNVTLRLFGESTFQTELATSGAYPNVEFIAADYGPGFSTDYLRVLRTSGVTSHRTQWEQGSEILSGWATAQSWTAGDVARVWDAHLLPGQAYRAQLYENGASLNGGIYMLSSAGGNRYIQRSGAATGSNGLSTAGEWFTYTAPADDWYGLVMITNDEAGGAYSLGLGPYVDLGAGAAVSYPDEVVWADVRTATNAWSAVGVRPAAGSSSWMSVWSCNDRFTSCYLDRAALGDRARYVVFDGHHVPAQTWYARADRMSGLGAQSVSYQRATDLLFDDPGEAVQQQGSFQANEVVQMWDLNAAAAPVQLAITVTPQVRNLDLSVAIFNSAGAAFIHGNSAAAGAVNAAGAGAAETLIFDASAVDIYGLAVVNQSGVAGGYRISIQDAAATAVPAALPARLALLPASPNPFNPRTTLQLALPAAAAVELAIYDLKGQRVRQLLAAEPLAAGVHAIAFDGSGDDGRPLSSGIYMCRMVVGGEVQSQKLALTK